MSSHADVTPVAQEGSPLKIGDEDMEDGTEEGAKGQAAKDTKMQGW